MTGSPGWAYLTLGDAMAVHTAALALYGGLDGVRDQARLESALAMAAHGFGPVEFFPTGSKLLGFA